MNYDYYCDSKNCCLCFCRAEIEGEKIDHIRLQCTPVRVLVHESLYELL